MEFSLTAEMVDGLIAPRGHDVAAPSFDPSCWAASGSASGRAGNDVGRVAAEQALASVAGEVQLVVMFSSSTVDPTVVWSGIAEVMGDVPIVGCSGPTVIASDGPLDDGIALLALGGSGLSVNVRSAAVEDGGHRSAARQSSECIEAVAGAPFTTLMVLAAGATSEPREIVRGCYEQTGAGIPLVGGCAAPGPTGSWVMIDGHVVESGVVTVGVGSRSPVSLSYAHGWRRTGEPMIVSSSDGAEILTLDGQPAIDRYLEVLGIPEPTSDAEWQRCADAHPLGLDHREHELVHCVVSVDVERRSLRWLREVPAGITVWATVGDEGTIIGSVDEAWDIAAAQLDGHRPQALVVFDCVGRAAVLGPDGRQREIDRVRERSGGASMVGVYTLGEFARRTGLVGYHNQTLAMFGIGRSG